MQYFLNEKCKVYENADFRLFMQKRHRRSIRPAEIEMTQNDDTNEKQQQQGVRYPDLFGDENGYDIGQGKRLYPDPNINRTWPTSSRFWFFLSIFYENF